ncbi:unnamed protein product [Bursaphelenchus okinawaensis]|uniref:Nuclear receptor domain-containing protein n=1 Tax=Bursaphelenchus okinawaensis TaxID=465554 RepID=A0A811KT83_9BILA|nr:unnamed protein product [Bursaphelenchus okinawaensis]CAG9112291.1 unnamed protein product [Bursaphelenchus okinawaensis]
MEYEYWEDDYGQCPSNQSFDEEDEEVSSTQLLLKQMMPREETYQHQIIKNHNQQRLRYMRMSRMTAPPSYYIKEKAVVSTSEATCAVCGDRPAKAHYGVLACYGCKGFFRRTLTGKYRYVCRFGNNCVVDKVQRNSCRYCRFQRCLEVGMDPQAVRPDRDLTGKQKVPRTRKRQMDEELINHMMRLQGDDWSRKIPVEAKVLLMQLLNIESNVVKGDVLSPNNVNYNEKLNLSSVSLRELFEKKPACNTRRTEMCYEPYRMARADELPMIAHRGAIAAVDWIESLVEMTEFIDTEDKIALVKSCYAPLTIFNFSARTAQNTENPDILCLCFYSYVPRKLPSEFNANNHLSNNLVDRTLNELVGPLRKLKLREEEVIPLKAIICLNPNAKGLSPEAQHHVAELRDKIQDMLFQVVKELHPVYNASSRFGNLLLLLPTITTLSAIMCENMQFCQTIFGNRPPSESLLNELFQDSRNDEPLITSTQTSSSPLFENPADISLQALDTFTKVVNHHMSKSDGSTQTESSDDCSSPLTSWSSRSMTADFSPSEHAQIDHMDITSFGLLEDDLTDSFPSDAVNLFTSTGCSELFGLTQ